MRPARLSAAVVVVLAVVGPAFAQNVLYTATVRGSEAEVRSGRSVEPAMYPTNRLRQGDIVHVVQEFEGGWLGILPPAGSFSWINARFLKPSGKDTWVVNVPADVRVPVLYGSSVHNEKPSVRGAEVGSGHLVVSVGDKVTADDGLWLPIQPPPGEVRYIRADAVARAPASAAGTPGPAPAAPGGAAPAWSTPPAVPTAERRPVDPAPLPVAGADPRWLRAQEAEQAGKIQEAIALYEELGRDVVNRDNALAQQCYNRADWLRSGQVGSVPPGYQPGRPTEARYAGAPGRIYPVAAGSPGAVPQATTCCVPQAACTPCPQPVGGQYCVRGYLRRSGRSIDYRPTYMVESSQGQALAYVTEMSGVDLKTYVGRNVEVWGPMGYRGDVRANYMTVTRVSPLP